ITPLAPISTFPLSLHDALPIFGTGAHRPRWCGWQRRVRAWNAHLAKKARMCSGTQAYPSVSSPTPGRTLLTRCGAFRTRVVTVRSEEHTSELQSRFDLVCRLLL